MIFNLLGAGLNSYEISEALSRDKRTVDNWTQRFINTGEMQVLKHNTLPRETTIDEDLKITLYAIENLRATRLEIKEKLELDVGVHTIGRRLKESKLFCRVASKRTLKRRP
jgi:transposase